jgi:sugar phosphate isomerase/epimerase
MHLTYHNHQEELQADGIEMVELLRRIDSQNLSLMFDIGHAHLAGVNVPEFFTRHHARIGGLHLRDIKNGEQVLLGKGELDLKALASIIHKENWQGLLIVEEYLRTTDFAWADSATTSDRDYLRRVFAS